MKSSRQAIAVLLLLTSALWLTAAAAPVAPPGSLHVPAEDDWWLPDWVQPVPNSGVYGAHNAPPGFVDVEGVVLPWRMIEPREGVYDWSLLTIRVTPYKAWGTEHPDEVIRNADGLRACAPTDYVGKFTSDTNAVDPPNSGKWWHPSWQSEVWRADMERVFARIAEHVKISPYGKAVVGFFITGGDDGQFVIHYHDHSEPTQRAFNPPTAGLTTQAVG